MEVSGAQLIAAITGLISTFSTIVAFLYRQAAKAKDDLIAEKNRAIMAMAKTIEYERTQKQEAAGRAEALASEIGEAVREMISGVEQIGPIVGDDGSRTRDEVKSTGRRVISRLGGDIHETD